jgi:predicted SprT family Zn-dependent metalloprotease
MNEPSLKYFALARKLMNEHGLHDWQFCFDRAKRRAGSCRHKRKLITLSSNYAEKNSEEDIQDTILHEIAHALAGPKVGHGPEWKLICLQIGARPARCYDDAVVMPKGRYHATCGACRKQFHRHRRPRGRGYYCLACGPQAGAITYTLAEATKERSS